MRYLKSFNENVKFDKIVNLFSDGEDDGDNENYLTPGEFESEIWDMVDNGELTIKDLKEFINNPPDGFTPGADDFGAISQIISEYDNDNNELQLSKGKLTDKEWVKLVELTIDGIRSHEGIRLGQSYMNSLHTINSDLYNEISGTENDPFFDDVNILNFINYLTKNN